ncbi:MAG: DUF6166 domain-containing protein [bacterium]
MKIYKGVRTPIGYRGNVYVDGVLLDIEPSKTIYDYDADSAEWGYYGSGPSQTALAILFDMTGDAVVAKRYHQEFKREFIATYDQDGFILLEVQIRAWLDNFIRNEGD